MGPSVLRARRPPSSAATEVTLTLIGPNANKPTFAWLNDAERDWVAQHVAAAPGFIAELTGEVLDGELTAEQLDAGWTAWIASGNANPTEVNDVINIFGLSFGQLLVDTLGLNWVVATDADGIDVVVIGQPGDLLVYPANVFAKRWEARTTGFLVALLEAITDARHRTAPGT